MKKFTILIILVFLVLACDPLSTGNEEEQQPPASIQPALSQTKEEVKKPTPTETEADIEEEAEVDVEEKPTSTETKEAAPGESQPAPEIDKWSLWVDGPHLRGANIWQSVVIPELDGTEFKGDGRVGPPYTQKDFDQLAAMGANYVSISGPGLFTETPPYTVDPGVEAHLDNLLVMIAQADMFATIGFRTGPGRSEFGLCCGGDSYFEDYFNDTVWEDQAAQDAWVEMWRYTAQRYGDNPIVAGYKLMVEPNSSGVFFDIYDPDEFYAEHAGTLYDWNQFYPRLVAGIREVDADTPILVGGNGWSGVAWLPYLHPTDDPRTVYIVHQYEPQDDYTHQAPDGRNSYPRVWDADYDGEDDQFNRAWLDNLLSTVDEFKSTHGVPVTVDEYGVNRWVPGAVEFMDDQIDLFEQRGMNQALWEWQTSWKPFADDVNDMTYRFGPDPHNRVEVPNDLMDVIKQNWARNAIRPSTLAAAAIPSADSSPPTSDPTDGNWWQPAVDTTWQWQLLDLPIDQSFEVDMYDIEMFDNDASTVADLHAQGHKVVCYISVGSWEEWRPDKDQFPASVIGKDYGGWPGEKWLDIRQIDLLAPIMRARLDECQAKGFDGIEPDNIDSYTNNTGFPLTYEDQLNYNIWLANEAHARGLSIGLKNDSEQVDDLLPYFDWALTEDCFAEGWCEEMLPFIAAGKPVFAAEYTDMGITTDQFCPQAQEMNFSAILKNRDLDAYREACGEDAPAPIILVGNVPPPPAGHIYHAVFPGEEIADSSPPPEDGIPYEEDGVSLEDLRSYEEHVGKTAAWTYFSHNWFRKRSFPLEAASWIRNTGSIPYIRLMLRSSAEQNVAEPTFTPERIINGEFDDDLRAWAIGARDFGSPLIVEYGTEVNGEWFSWNGIWNGGGTPDGYGDPSEYDGPEKFRDAYRHIIQIARDEDASNITWVFHVDGNDIPDEEWNRLEEYYPGDEWIDWLGVSIYGAGEPTDDECPPFREGMDEVYPRLAALSPDKSVVLLEFGVTANNHFCDQAEWTEAALTDLIAFRWPRLIGFSWWNEKWENDDDPSHNTNMRVQNNPDLAAVFQRLVGDESKVLGRVQQPATVAGVRDVSNWFYMINVNLEPEMVEQIVDSEYDMVVLDFIPSETNNTDYPMAEVIDQLHSAARPKLAIAYIDIGQAEDFRTYWQSGWDIGNPEWIVANDPDGWEGNYPVAYWEDDWRDIWLGEKGYLQAIVDAGFDGVYLDWVEAYSDENIITAAKNEGVDPRQEMIWWVGDIAEYTQTQKPDFIVIAQNAAELAENDEYLDTIDAIAQEQVWFDGSADNDPPGDCPLPRTDADIDTEAYRESLSPACQEQYDQFPDSTLHVSSEEYLRDLTVARNKGEVIFTVDYALEPENVAWVYETSRALGFVPFAGNRALDRYVEPQP